jgi:hypothetical protein
MLEKFQPPKPRPCKENAYDCWKDNGCHPCGMAYRAQAAIRELYEALPEFDIDAKAEDPPQPKGRFTLAKVVVGWNYDSGLCCLSDGQEVLAEISRTGKTLFLFDPDPSKAGRIVWTTSDRDWAREHLILDLPNLFD